MATPPVELDNPAWHALVGPHSSFAESSTNGLALRYEPEVSPFYAVDEVSAEAWDGLAELGAATGFVVLARAGAETPPAGWKTFMNEPGTQYVAHDLDPEPDVELLELGAADADDMLELVALTEPGPFAVRTHEMGRYLGVREGGRLIAMAGQRLRTHGYVEVSAVCVHPDARRRGLGAVLTLAVAHDVRRGGQEAMLHVREGNDVAHRLYRRIGFEPRTEVHFGVFGPPRKN